MRPETSRDAARNIEDKDAARGPTTEVSRDAERRVEARLRLKRGRRIRKGRWSLFFHRSNGGDAQSNGPRKNCDVDTLREAAWCNALIYRDGSAFEASP
jgi:hypothetical protein